MTTERDYLDEAARLAGVPLIEEGMQVKDVIKALRDTDYKDPEAQFKMVQLLKGLAVSAKDDETAKKFLGGVSDALTTAAKKVLGESLDEAVAMPDDVRDAGDEYLRGQAKKITPLVSGMATFVKKKTGKPVGMKLAGEIFRYFLQR